jgi:hypothetical protein
MEDLTAKEVLQQIEEARQEFGSITMILDGAQVHFVAETILEGLKTTALTLLSAKGANPITWNDRNYGTIPETIKAYKELGLTGITVLKTLLEALPDNLKLSDSLSMQQLDTVENIFRSIRI